ncbi:MAG TPA: hypothetical protein VJ000_01350, partial [Thermodesulfovibrionia bacterium]|nr:hypothetical protein [Thermodesulfovibrionia bacterium]
MKLMKYHQGDVFLEEIEVLPKGEQKIVRHDNVAFGEITGHAHCIKGCEIVEIGRREFLVLKENKPMTHEDHPAIPAVKSGVYRIRIQQEYFPE